jgi:Tol biopolymer transport system component
VTATNTGGSSSKIISIQVSEVVPSISYTGSPFTYKKGTPITDLSPTNSGGPISSCSVLPALPSGLSLTSSCVITGTPTVIIASANYTITAANSAGSSAGATISIGVVDAAPAISFTASPYTFMLNTLVSTFVPTNTGGGIASCTISPTLPTGLSFNTSTCAISGTPTALSTATNYTVTATNPGGSSAATVNITVRDSAPVITYAGSPYIFAPNNLITTVTPSNTGGAITSCASSPSLPTGLSLDQTTCALMGTPTTNTAAASYSITATNSGGSNSTAITITISSMPSLTYTGSPYSWIINNSIGTITPTNTGAAVTSCSISPSLPAGLSLGTDCTLTGTPTLQSSPTAYTITATNSSGSSSVGISIAVITKPVLTYSGSPYVFTKGVAISQIIPTNTGSPATSCSPGTLAPGVAVASDCSLSGTPTALSSATNYTITPTNSAGTGSGVTINITVNDAAPVLSYSPTSYTYVLRTAITAITATNSGGAITNCVSSPTLPTGLTLNTTTCGVTGTPSVTSSTTSYTITASNTGGSSSKTLSIRVKDQPQIVFHSTMALSGTANGTANNSSNIWKVSQDGVDKVHLTANTLANLDSIFPSFSADGSQIAFSSLTTLDGSTDGVGAPTSYNIWTISGTGTSPSPLTSNTLSGLDSDTSPIISPDGSKIAFASKMSLSGLANGTATNSYNIWVMNTTGVGKIALTQNTNSNLDSLNPVFSPDSKTIYFQSLTHTTGGWDNSTSRSYNIWKVGVDGTGLTRLTNQTSSGFDSTEPHVSPDGSTIVFTSLMRIGFTSPGQTNIWKVSSSGSGLGNLTDSTNTGANSKNPSYSPDGTLIVFATQMNNSGLTNSYNICTMGTDGSGQNCLTSTSSSSQDSINPSFSPDQLHIAFQSKMKISGTTANSTNIWVVDTANVVGPTALTRNTNFNLNSVLGTVNTWYQE